MSFQEPTRVELAWHEASHAYAYTAIADGCPDELGLGRSPSGANRGWCARGTILYRVNESLPELDPKSRPAVAWQAAAEVIVALAGPFGECRYRNSGDAAITQTFFERNLQVFLTPDALDEDGDFAKVRSCFEYARPNEPEQALFRLVQLVNTVVNDNWEAIGRLAGRLMKKRVLSMTQLDWWFSRHEAQDFRFHADMFAAA